MKKETKFAGMKIAAALVLLLASGIFVYTRYYYASPMAVEDQEEKPATSQLPNAPMSVEQVTPEMRRSMRAELFAELDLTDEQWVKVNEIIAKMDDKEGEQAIRDRMLAFHEVLTPEQVAKARQLIQSKVRDRIKSLASALPPDQQKKLDEKLAKRIAERERQFDEAVAEKESQSTAE